MAHGGQRQAQLAGHDVGSNAVKGGAGHELLLFGQLRLDEDSAVAHFFWDERQAVGWDGREMVGDVARCGADLALDLGLHAVGHDLLLHRLAELGLPGGDGLAVLGFEGLHAAEHADVVLEAPVNLAVTSPSSTSMESRRAWCSNSF